MFTKRNNIKVKHKIDGKIIFILGVLTVVLKIWLLLIKRPSDLLKDLIYLKSAEKIQKVKSLKLQKQKREEKCFYQNL